jgi:2-octaprenyl-6-methoxyphenol hydroxylase
MATDTRIKNTTALVAGAGPAGLAAACLLASTGRSVVSVAPSQADDPRTVALMAPSLKLLEHIGVWSDDLKAMSAPLKQLHIIDDTGNLVAAPPLRFSAAESNLDAFGWNIPVSALVVTLRARAAQLGVKFVEGEVVGATVTDCVVVQTSVGDFAAQFCVAADGRNSALRKAAGISVEEWSFDQSALVTRFSHSRDHEGVSTEWHKYGGPFTTVPLPGMRSALVWMDKPHKIAALMEKSVADLAQDIQLQGHGTLGKISTVGKPHSFAMRGVKASSFAKNRIYLVGEAAHVFPPVGAQGLNMSLRDAGHMADVVADHDDPGSNPALQAYDAFRRVDVAPRQMAITMMNRSLLSDVLPPHLARAAGLAALSLLPPLRNLAMREGLSPSGGLPLVMRG